jgi:hypothetical protein
MISSKTSQQVYVHPAPTTHPPQFFFMMVLELKKDDFEVMIFTQNSAGYLYCWHRDMLAFLFLILLHVSPSPFASGCSVNKMLFFSFQCVFIIYSSSRHFCRSDFNFADYETFCHQKKIEKKFFFEYIPCLSLKNQYEIVELSEIVEFF